MKTFFPTPRRLVSLLLLAAGLTAALPAAAQPVFWHRLMSDARSVLIIGQAMGSSGEPSRLVIKANGVNFSITIQPTPEGGQGQTAVQTCQALESVINGYTLGARLTPEFEAFCIDLPGEAARLFIQASVTSYPPPSSADQDIVQAFKRERRIVYLDTLSTDDSQRPQRK